MGMGMSLGFFQRMETRQEQRQKLTLTQRLQQKHLQAQNLLMTLRIQMLEALHPGGILNPDGKCPYCGYQLKPIEILKGFLADPLDTTTGCPKCSNRFQPKLKSSNQSGSYELPFYCETQTVEKLRQIGALPYEEFQKNHPAVLASARFYWGGLKTGFSRLAIEYLLDPPSSWKDKILPFLGKCPDTLIAEVCNVSPGAVGRLRKSRKIKVYKPKKRRTKKR